MPIEQAMRKYFPYYYLYTMQFILLIEKTVHFYIIYTYIFLENTFGIKSFRTQVSTQAHYYARSSQLTNKMNNIR